MRSIEMKTAVSGGRVRDDAIAHRRSRIASAPRRIGAGADFSTPEGGALALVLGILIDAGARGKLALEPCGWLWRAVRIAND